MARKELLIDPLFVLAGVSLALVFVVAALVREIRLRRALQVLLRRLLNYWRSPTDGPSSSPDTAVADDRARRL